jgi:hypothetical protein
MSKRRSQEKWGKQPAARTSAALPYSSRNHLLTPGERRFYHHGLKPAIGNRYLISFKVRLADVITAKDWESPYGRKIAQKHLDFVLVTPKTTRIVAAIELNDASHDASDRQQRDEFLSQALQSAGIPLITFPIYHKYDGEKIRHRILAAITTARQRKHRSSHQG